ncbi:hypothetical protein EUGRSUZ_G02705 [Eucalyptus grandis]|uniref:Uncharacterized protein n=2 Tax=Eucalyptus grandis TaxID=71139 RepID=A0ACC3K7E9_EUCGR|nr:hypothetical protein EUGRSUZ_G02705 [Eucalyptus grandis]
MGTRNRPKKMTTSHALAWLTQEQELLPKQKPTSWRGCERSKCFDEVPRRFATIPGLQIKDPPRFQESERRRPGNLDGMNSWVPHENVRIQDDSMSKLMTFLVRNGTRPSLSTLHMNLSLPVRTEISRLL